MRQRTKEFQELQKEFYERLEREGFDEIEDTSNDARLLKSWHSFKFQDIDPIQAEATREYFMAAERLLHTKQFKRDLEREIWELHCKGFTSIEINAQNGMNERTIRHIVQTIAAEIKKT